MEIIRLNKKEFVAFESPEEARRAYKSNNASSESSLTLLAFAFMLSLKMKMKIKIHHH